MREYIFYGHHFDNENNVTIMMSGRVFTSMDNTVERILLDFSFLSNAFLEAYVSTVRMKALKLAMDR